MPVVVHTRRTGIYPLKALTVQAAVAVDSKKMHFSLINMLTTKAYCCC